MGWEGRPPPKPTESTAVQYARLNPKLSGDDGEEISLSQLTVQMPIPMPSAPDMPMKQSAAASSAIAPAPMPPVAASRRMPAPNIRVNATSWDGADFPQSADDGEPLPRQLDRRPSPQRQRPQPAPAPAPAKSADVQFEFVTRGRPPLPPKERTLHVPRFEWVPGRLECKSTPHPCLKVEGTRHDDETRSHVALPNANRELLRMATSESSVLPPSYDNAARLFMQGASLWEHGVRPLGISWGPPPLPEARAPLEPAGRISSELKPRHYDTPTWYTSSRNQFHVPRQLGDL